MKHQRFEGWVKRNDRHEVDPEATVYRADGSSAGVRLSNLSYDGCQLEGTSLLIGERIRVALPRLGEVEAQVRWVLPVDGSAGVQFLSEDASSGGATKAARP